MFDQYLEKYKHVSDETFAYTVKTTFEQRKEFIDESSACLEKIAETLKKMPSDSGNLKIIGEFIVRVIRDFNVPIKQINYEIENRKL